MRCFVAIGDCFRVGEVWESPRGTFYKVTTGGPHVTLRAGLDGKGRKIRRGWDNVAGWVRPPAHNAPPSTEGGEDGSR